MKKLVIILFVTSMFVACKGKSGTAQWPQKEKDAFNEQCVKGAETSMGEAKAKSYCSCMLTKIEAKYPEAANASKLDVATMTEMAKDCVK